MDPSAVAYLPLYKYSSIYCLQKMTWKFKITLIVEFCQTASSNKNWFDTIMSPGPQTLLEFC